MLIPAHSPPHKELSQGASSRDRLNMLNLAAEGVPWLSVEACELEREGVSWTIDTLEYLLGKYSDIEGRPALVIGDDLAAGFSRWRRAEDIARIAEIILARRPPDGPEPVFGVGGPPPFPFPFTRLENPPLPISSSAVRERIRTGKSWRYLVPDSVYRYIEGHVLYDCCKVV